MSFITTSDRVSEFGFVNWRPKDANHSLMIYESGGPLVDDDGSILAPAELPGSVWKEFVVGLPTDDWEIHTPYEELVAA